MAHLGENSKEIRGENWQLHTVAHVLAGGQPIQSILRLSLRVKPKMCDGGNRPRVMAWSTV